MTEDQTKKFVTRAEVQALIAKEVKILMSQNIAPVLTELVEQMLINGLQVGHDFTKYGGGLDCSIWEDKQ